MYNIYIWLLIVIHVPAAYMMVIYDKYNDGDVCVHIYIYIYIYECALMHIHAQSKWNKLSSGCYHNVDMIESLQHKCYHNFYRNY